MKSNRRRTHIPPPATRGGRGSRSKCIAVVVAILSVLASLWNVWVGHHWRPSLTDDSAASRSSSVPSAPSIRFPADGEDAAAAAIHRRGTRRDALALPKQQHGDKCIEKKNGTNVDDTVTIFHIGIADREGGVGTALYQLILSQLDYAERHGWTPWVHLLPNVSNVIDVTFDVDSDDSLGATTSTKSKRNATTISFAAIRRTVSRIEPSRRQHWRHVVPGALVPLLANDETATTMIEIPGNGIWTRYFAPVSSFDPTTISAAGASTTKTTSSCRRPTLHYATIPLSDIALIIPGLHGFGPIRCWRYDYLPEYERRPHQSFSYWIAPSRVRAAELVARHIRPHRYLVERADRLVPGASSSSSSSTNDHSGDTVPATTYLGLHIRHSDKAAGRKVVPVATFLPYATAFLEATSTTTTTKGNAAIYLATDSRLVIDTIRATWPAAVVARMTWSDDGEMVRSNDTTAVFDLVRNHDQSNQDAIVEILALSHCHYLVHGLSALSEAALWHNRHILAINVEDDAPPSPREFQTLVAEDLLHARDGPRPTSDFFYPEEVWYRDVAVPAGRSVGLSLLLSSHASAAASAKTESQQQLSMAACHGFNGILWIRQLRQHYDDDNDDTSSASAMLLCMAGQLEYAHLHNLVPWIYFTDNIDHLLDPKVHYISVDTTEHYYYPQEQSDGTYRLAVVGSGSPQPRRDDLHNGIWSSYFAPVSNFAPDDQSCQGLPLLVLEDGPAAAATAHQSAVEVDARKSIQFLPYLINRAADILADNENACLGVHIQLADNDNIRPGGGRHKIRAGEYLPYIEAFVQAGGTCIYLVTDTEKARRYLVNHLPDSIRPLIRTQGNHTVRSEKGDYPTHRLDDHHRVNSETLVDVLVLSTKCVVLIHSNNAVAQAVQLLNPSIQTVNLADEPPQTPKHFEMMALFALGKDDAIREHEEEVLIEPRVLVAAAAAGRPCRPNAIVYLAQKNHSSYAGRDSYSNLLQSIDLLYQNYLSHNNNLDRTDIFIFHTSDFDESDLRAIEARIGSVGVVRLVGLSRTRFWTRPPANAWDQPEDWYAWPLFSEGYRRMMHWFAIDIWRFFEYWNEQSSCDYRYIFRLDEDSYIHSPIGYDIFNVMATQQYVYGFRMCAYEMQVTRRMSAMWKNRHEKFMPRRKLSLEMCGFYNNFFVADLNFFTRPDVAEFLDFIDRQGHIYRRRLGDLMIHSMAVYWFAESKEIYRFLDFTYEHGTKNTTDGCLLWGGMQAGYNDRNALATVTSFQSEQLARGCAVNASALYNADLSPSYNRLTKQVSLLTVTAGRVELPSGRGILSG